MRRRDFLYATTGAAIVSACGAPSLGAAKGRRILVLGGTNFVGPAIVERAVARGHEVTLFNRGITRPHLFPELEKIRGDRTGGLEGLSGLGSTRSWDAVIDVWPERSDMVDTSVSVLRDRSDFYYFISSIAVYHDFGRPGITEDASTRLDEPGTYGGEKALAESTVEAAFAGRSGVARCHAILGPRDDGTAYHYWLRRLAEEDEVLAPGTGDDPVQCVDVRDLAEWTVDCVEQARPGPHNICGPADPMSLRELLERTRAGIRSQARLTWVEADFLRDDQGVFSFSDMPFWAPLDEDPGFFQISNRRALTAGLAFRPIEETARDAWNWYRSSFLEDATFPAGGMGMSRERELAILDAWRRR